MRRNDDGRKIGKIFSGERESNNLEWVFDKFFFVLGLIWFTFVFKYVMENEFVKGSILKLIRDLSIRNSFSDLSLVCYLFSNTKKLISKLDPLEMGFS